ncbi:hypothetical protein [Helicobacter sp.]|uniref:hypothetical protein n=1 Tax=Helicobacter sp. TaxID=218 RepID=UPI00388DF960
MIFGIVITAQGNSHPKNRAKQHAPTPQSLESFIINLLYPRIHFLTIGRISLSVVLSSQGF